MRITKNPCTVRLLLIGFGLFALLASGRVVFTAQTPVVYVAPIEGMIDLGLAPFVQRVLSEATQEGAAAVILEINTFGGSSSFSLFNSFIGIYFLTMWK